MSNERHNYEYDVDTTSASAPANVVKLVGKNKRVLEVGCGPGSITKILTNENNCKVTGIELDKTAIEKAEKFCENIFQADLNSTDWYRPLNSLKRFDVVVAADVLEHLYNPWLTLKQMSNFINEDGYLVISIPHIGHAAIMGCLMSGNFEYRDWGLLDRTHIRFFCLHNIQEMFVGAGLKIVDVRYVTKQPEETEFALQWCGLANDVKACLRGAPHSNIYQVVVKAVPIDRELPCINLSPSVAVGDRETLWRSLRHMVARNLTSESKENIRKMVGIFGVKL